MPSCAHCREGFELPPGLTPGQRASVAARRRGSKPLEAMRLLKELGASVAASKAVVMHITLQPGQCHRCRASLSPGTVTPCGKCHALNFDW